MLNEIRIEPAKLRASRPPDLSQAEAARKVGLSRQQLNNYETGRSVPAADVVARLCILYGVRIEDLTA